jgi:hypothetical protein
MAMIGARADADAVDAPRSIGCGHARIALTRSPVMRVKRIRSGMSMFVSGSMISNTSPPEQKFPPAPGDHDRP